MRLPPAILFASLAFAGLSFAAEPLGPQLPGHSMHGEAFDEGPRQAATLMPGMSSVHFAVTTANPDAQKFFDQGVGQLHGFWYFEAERSFRQAAVLDPACAMNYWGMAMANVNNAKRATKFMAQATEKKAQASRREQLWIDAYAAYFAESKKEEKARAIALVKALEDLTFEFPDDVEAKAFLVLQIYENKSDGIAISSRRAVDALAREVLAANPMHPGAHHYRIHFWNGDGGDKYAIESAARCGQTAPGIAHLWHMSGHTFSNLKRYADAAWQQEASARVDHAHLIATHLMPDQIHNFAHNNDWLVKNLAYLGRVQDAVDLAKNMIELPRLGGTDGKSFTLGRERLLDTLLRFELWDELIALGNAMYLAPQNAGPLEAPLLAGIGAGWYRRGELDRGDHQLTALETLLKKKREERIDVAEKAEAKAAEEKKPDDEQSKAMGDSLRKGAPAIKRIESALAELRVYRALAAGKPDDAKAELKKANDISSERKARLWLELGDKTEAVKLAQEAVKADEKQTPALANLAHILWQTDKKSEALATFKKLRELSAQLDLDVPLYAQLAPLAMELKLEGDWRVPLKFPADSGTRPELASLGPFRWHPTAAPAWTLPERDEHPRSLADYRGKPVLVVFYLGAGCSHCIEQLNVFAPMAKEFAAEQISIVAVSTDTAAGLGDTFARVKETAAFPFPIVADPTLAAFKAYRAFDDFEHIPLHGTYLIDAAGLIRWQDISYQPFRDAKWLLGEARRLLSIPASMPTENTAAK
jgi:peroxiredoxin